MEEVHHLAKVLEHQHKLRSPSHNEHQEDLNSQVSQCRNCQEVTSVILVCLCDDSGTSTNSTGSSTYNVDWCLNTGQMEQLGTEL